MPRFNSLILGLSLCVLPGFVAVIPVFGQTVIQEVTVESRITRPAAARRIMETIAIVDTTGKPDFAGRISNLDPFVA